MAWAHLLFLGIPVPQVNKLSSMPFFCPLSWQNSTFILSVIPSFYSLAISLTELVGKDTATVWLQQATAVGFPILKLLKEMPMR